MMMTAVRWRFNVAIATKSDMAYHPDAHKERAKRNLGIRLNYCKEHSSANHVEGCEGWFLSQAEALELAHQLLSKINEVKMMEMK
jgi:hypothetical protein